MLRPCVYVYRVYADWRRRQRVLIQRWVHNDDRYAHVYRARAYPLRFFWPPSLRPGPYSSQPLIAFLFSQLRWVFKRLVTQPGSGPADRCAAELFFPLLGADMRTLVPARSRTVT